MTTTQTKAPTFVERAFPITDFEIRTESGERFLDAYAAVFNQEAEIRDIFEGEFLEVIRPGAFTKTIRENRAKFRSFFNHARTIFGMPDQRFTMPIGVSVEMREDKRGLWTVTRFARGEAAELAVQAIEDETVDAMSFSGKFEKSNTIAATGGKKLDLIERTEIRMREYGPGIFPAYKGAKIADLRSEQLIAALEELDPEERTALIERFGLTATPTGEPAQSGGHSSDGAGTQEPPEPPAHSERAALEAALAIQAKRHGLTKEA